MTTAPPKAITRIHVEGFRSLRDVTLEPGRVTVLIGPNGSGKSNLLSFLKLVPLVHTGALQDFVQDHGGAGSLLHYGPRVTPSARFRIEFEQETGQNAYSAGLKVAPGDRLTLREETAWFKKAGTEEFWPKAISKATAESPLREMVAKKNDPTLRTVSWWLWRMSFYHFHDTSLASCLRQHAVGSQDRFLHSEGRNLAAFLYRLKQGRTPADAAAWRRISTLVPRMAPGIAALCPTGVAADGDPPSRVRLDWLDDRGETFGVQDLSDGTLRAIALVTALAQPATPTSPAFISIDEPELGLHPAALSLIAGLVRSVSARCQVVLATQSPALLDEFSPDQVVVCERRDGQTVLQRLDPLALEGWLEDYTLSQLYDKNLLGGRP